MKIIFKPLPVIFAFLPFLIIFLLGITIGSFANVVIFRLESGEEIIKKRSHCRFCQTVLTPKELIPLLSFFFQGGRCRHCGKKISWQYPLVEGASAALFILIYLIGQKNNWPVLETVFWLIAAAGLLIIFVYDLKHLIIPDKVLAPLIAAAGLRLIVNGQMTAAAYQLLGAFTAAGFFYIIHLASRGNAMGLGDVKLAFFMGLALAPSQLALAIYLAFLLGAAFGLILLIKKQKTLKSRLAFGPFLISGLLIILFSRLSLSSFIFLQ